MSFSVAACFVLTLAVCWWILRPHFEPTLSASSFSDAPVQSTLHDQRERCVQVLKDLELDLATGKLSPEEYARMRASVGHELLTIVDKIKSS